MAPEMIGSESSSVGGKKGKKSSKKLKVPKKDGKEDKIMPRNSTKADMYSLGVREYVGV